MSSPGRDSNLWIGDASAGCEHEGHAGEEPSILPGPEVLLPACRLVGGQDAVADRGPRQWEEPERGLRAGQVADELETDAALEVGDDQIGA